MKGSNKFYGKIMTLTNFKMILTVFKMTIIFSKTKTIIFVRNTNLPPIIMSDFEPKTMRITMDMVSSEALN